jgi:hypothetical protein
LWKGGIEAPSEEGFYRFIGEMKGEVPRIDFKYISGLAKDPNKAVETLQSEVGSLVGFNYASSAGNPHAKITLLTGNRDRPLTHVVDVPKDAGIDVKNTLLALGGYVHHLSGPEYASARELAIRATEKVDRWMK